MSLARTPDGTRLGNLGAAIRERFGHLLHEAAKFGVIGAVSYFIDVGTFNALRTGVLSDRPLTAKIISTVLATTFTSAIGTGRFATVKAAVCGASTRCSSLSTRAPSGSHWPASASRTTCWV